jgi:trehalose 6-phosphate phosphatase
MKRSPRAIPHLLPQWRQIAARIRTSRRVLVFLDFDGTLAAIAARPDRVRVKPAMRRALQKLVGQKRVTATVISGRRRAELQRCVAVPGLNYLGLYGWDRGGKETLSAAAHVALFRAHLMLLKELAAFPGVWIEPKHNSFSIHLLNARPNTQRRARLAVRAFLGRFAGTLQLFENLRDLEVVPHRMPDKGAAVREWLARPTSRAALVFFFGDDLSDEPAFRAIRGGISVLVGKKRPTHARFRLRNPDEVALALSKIKEALE